jgi:hypothetical protein
MLLLRILLAVVLLLVLRYTVHQKICYVTYAQRTASPCAGLSECAGFLRKHAQQQHSSKNIATHARQTITCWITVSVTQMRK